MAINIKEFNNIRSVFPKMDMIGIKTITVFEEIFLTRKVNGILKELFTRDLEIGDIIKANEKEIISLWELNRNYIIAEIYVSKEEGGATALLVKEVNCNKCFKLLKFV